MGIWLVALLASTVGVWLYSWSVAVALPDMAPCTVATQLVHVRGIGEASGVAASRRTPGLLWMHNDSGEPVLFAVDGASGAVKGEVQVTGARVDDWEDIAIGPCGRESCLYIADIGDNKKSRREITIYRVPEPRPDQQAIEPAETWSATYPDGAHDAEALFVASNAIFVVTKDAPSRTALYRMPLAAAGGGATRRLELVARLPHELVTGAGMSSDGAWVVLRTNDALLFYPTRELAAGTVGQPRHVDLTQVGERQGEGVAGGAGGVVYLVGEGGGRGGTLATLRCTLR